MLDGHELRDGAAHGASVHGEARTLAEVGHGQHAHGEREAVRRDDPGRGADAGLEVVARHAGAGPDAAFGHGARGGRVQRGADVLFVHVHAAQVVEEAVVALPHHGHGRVLDADPRVAVHHPAHGGVVDGADALRVGEQHRCLEQAPLADGADADELADAVGDVGAGDDTLVPDVAGVGEDGGDARAGGPAARWQIGPAPRDGTVTDGHAGHVGDGVQRAGGQGAHRDAQVTGSRTRRLDHAVLSRRSALQADRSGAP